MQSRWPRPPSHKHLWPERAEEEEEVGALGSQPRAPIYHAHLPPRTGREQATLFPLHPGEGLVQGTPEPFLEACRGGLDSEPAGGGRRGGFRSGEVTSLKSKEESLQRAQMVASSTSPSYCPVRTGLSFFKLAAGWGGRKGKRQVEKIGNEMQREHRECSKETATNLEIRWERE